MQGFLDYLKQEKNKAENTVIAYKRDIVAFDSFLSKNRNKSLEACAESDAVAYVLELNNQNKSKSTINRSSSSLRTFYEYKINQGSVTTNPFEKIKTSKTEAREIDYLTLEEIEQLIALTDDSPKGLRDRALMEFMYGTGARVTEVVRLQITDVNLRMGFVTLRDVSDESRIVPLGQYAKDALYKYLSEGFTNLKGSSAEEDDYVFINFRGEVLSRQGIWKILKDYGNKIGIGDKMTTQIFRDSFAVHILQNGGDLRTLQELMGFDDMTVALSYLSAIDIHVREVFARCHPRA